MKRYGWNSLFSLLLLLLYSNVFACEVPVFRYALERWSTERYVLSCDTSNGSAALPAALDYLQSSSSAQGGLTNIGLQLSSGALPGGPEAALACPRPNGKTINIWSGHLTEQTARRIVESPLRREIASRLGDGQTAVWVLLTSGNSDRDRAALETLESSIAKSESSLALPEAVASIDGEGLPELRVDFSVLELQRADPEEAIFSRMLVASEPDLVNYSDQPIAFPVFGRGRVLYALVGDGITRGNVLDACAFLVGPCACEIKDLSPGMDLLMTADWSGMVGGSWVDRISGGPLTSLAAIIGVSRGNSSGGIGGGKPSRAPLYAILATLGLVLAVVVIVSLRIVKSSKSRDK